jgi:hypothetical protein|tara:strand:+ start:545 stop:988 length:444 start_codon:yes stop_codon:yes gene_type:complete
MTNRHVIEGDVAFCHLRTPDVYKGAPKDNYEITVSISDEDSEKLKAQGVKVKDYNGTAQRHFTTKEKLTIFSPDMTVWDGDEIARGSRVKLVYQLSKEPYDNYGYSAYVSDIQIIRAGARPIPPEFEPVQESLADTVETVTADDPPF